MIQITVKPGVRDPRLVAPRFELDRPGSRGTSQEEVEAVTEAIIRNDPGINQAAVAMFVTELCAAAADAGDGVVVMTDWYRSREENAAVGGRPNSLHLRGLAADFRLGPAALSLGQAWRQRGWDWVSESDHEHLEMDR